MGANEARLKAKHKTTIGGQALIEGVMMRGPEKIGIAVRTPDKNIEKKVEKLNTLAMKNGFFKLPFLRGIVGLVEAMVMGTKSLMYSADFYPEEEVGEKSKIGKSISRFTDKLLVAIEKYLKVKKADIEMFFTILVSFALAIGIFMILPSFVTSVFKRITDNHITLNILEGIFRVTIFFIYVIWISKLEEIERVFQYHGAEHKTIHCYENQEELTVENVKKYPILHGRCGTSFLFMVMIVSIFVLSFFGWPNPLQRFLTRIVMFPVIAGITYEINRIIGRSDSRLCYILSYPGLMIQKLATVKEPSDDQIEVAIEALKLVIPKDKEADLW